MRGFSIRISMEKFIYLSYVFTRSKCTPISHIYHQTLPIYVCGILQASKLAMTINYDEKAQWLKCSTNKWENKHFSLTIILRIFDAN